MSTSSKGHAYLRHQSQPTRPPSTGVESLEIRISEHLQPQIPLSNLRVCAPSLLTPRTLLWCRLKTLISVRSQLGPSSLPHSLQHESVFAAEQVGQEYPCSRRLSSHARGLTMMQGPHSRLGSTLINIHQSGAELEYISFNILAPLWALMVTAFSRGARNLLTTESGHIKTKRLFHCSPILHDQQEPDPENENPSIHTSLTHTRSR